jgi:putative intracellular protease/amidase
MKKSLVLPMMVVVLAAATMAFGQDRPKVLLVAAEISDDMEFMAQNEVRPMEQLLNQAGYDVMIASESGVKLGFGSAAITPDMKLAEVKIEDYKGVAFPCMGARYPHGMRMPDGMVAVARSAFQKGLPIAAQGTGVSTLWQAKILEGKNYAGIVPDLPGAIYKGHGVVQDGNVITAGGCPNARIFNWKETTADLMAGFIRLLQQ